MTMGEGLKHWWQVHCKWCGEPFPTTRFHARTCGPRCRIALFRRGSLRDVPPPVSLGYHRTMPGIERPRFD